MRGRCDRSWSAERIAPSSNRCFQRGTALNQLRTSISSEQGPTVLVRAPHQRIQPIFNAQYSSRALNLAQGCTLENSKRAQGSTQAVGALPYCGRNEDLCREEGDVKRVRQSSQHCRGRCVDSGALWTVGICLAWLEEDAQHVVETPVNDHCCFVERSMGCQDMRELRSRRVSRIITGRVLCSAMR